MKKSSGIARFARSCRRAGWIRLIEGEIPVVQPAPTESLEVVVVGPAGVDMAVDNSRIGPYVVGVGPEIARRQIDHPVQVVDRAHVVAAHVVGVDRGRSQPISCHELAAARRDADLFEVPEHAVALGDCTLRLAIAEVVDDAAVARVDEILTHICRRRGPDAPREVIGVTLRKDDEFWFAADLDSGPFRDRLSSRVGFDGGRRLDVDALVEIAEGRDDLASIQLLGYICAVDAYAAEVLVVSLVGASADQRVFLADAEAQFTGAAQPIDARRHCAQFCARNRLDGDSASAWLLR